MTALSTLGSIVAKKTGLPAQAASAPGDASVSAPATATPAPTSKIAVVPSPLSAFQNAGISAAPTSTPAIGGQSGKGITTAQLVHGIQSNSLSGIAQRTGNTALQQTLDSQAVNYYNDQITQGTAAQQQADANVATYQAQVTQATQGIAQLNGSGVGNWDYESATANYDPKSGGGAPQVLIQNSNHGAGGVWTGTFYTLQSDGTYKQMDYNNLSQYQYNALMQGHTAAYVNNPGAISAFTKLAQSQAQLKSAQTASSAAATQIANGKTGLAKAQADLSAVTNTIAQNDNNSALGAALGSITGGFNSAYQTDVDTANRAQTAQEQQVGLSSVGSSGAAAQANAFGTANIAQTNAQQLNVQHAGLVDQQAQQVGTALQSAISAASSQSGLQLQTMQQDLSAAVTALQNDLQYASGEQALAIQQYINSLQNQEARLKNAIGSGAVTDQIVTSVGTSVASGVAGAAATYAASAKKSGTS